jgi:hypothetical protein
MLGGRWRRSRSTTDWSSSGSAVMASRSLGVASCNTFHDQLVEVGGFGSAPLLIVGAVVDSPRRRAR